ncbi:MAG: rhomboid family intramembrane serine protease [Arcicella sp.]|jgi:membrane associated rhomboid family serine protease|nr:rhomboid family intramembrane serine protease [Arcicella sp.]
MRTPSITPIVRAIMAINIIVFIVQSINPQYDRMIVDLFGLHYFTSEKFNPIQLITYMFVHSGIGHIFGNMLGLFFLGPILEMFWGEKRFLTFYLITGIGAGLIYMGLKYYDFSTLQAASEAYLKNPDFKQFESLLKQFYSEGIPSNAYSLLDNPGNISLKESVLVVEESMRAVLNTPMIGASGAVFGVMTGFALLFPNTELMLFPIPIPIKAKYFVTFYGLYEIYAGIQKMPGDNVAHFAHIGGMIFALILIKIWGKDRQSFY